MSFHLSVTSQCSVETTERIKLVFGTGAILGVSYALCYKGIRVKLVSLTSHFQTVFCVLDLFCILFVVTARSGLRKVLFLAPSVCIFCV